MNNKRFSGNCRNCACPCPCPCPCPPRPSCGIRITSPENGGRADPGDPVIGTGEPGCVSELYIDGTFVACVPIDVRGTWRYQPDDPWTPGRHCVRAILRCPGSTDPNPPEDTSCFETGLPTCPPPDIDVPQNLEVIASSLPSIAGRGIPGSTMNVILLDAGGNQIFNLNTQVFEDGEWGVQSPVELPDGTYTIVATQLGGSLCIAAEASRVFSVFTINTEALNVNLISLKRGQTFRTVDMVMTGSATPDTSLSIYYLLLTPGQPVPDANEVIGYNDAAALTTGNAVRGFFTRALIGTTQTFPFTLSGKENITPLPLETGVMDGFNYNVYVVGVTTSGHSTGVLTLFESAMGMPFASGNGVTGDPFFVRMCTPAEMAFYPDLTQGNPGNRAGVTENARILDNIEGMQVLYDETAAVHGMPDSLSLVYRLDDSFDLINYASAWGGNGWRSIGNVDAGLLTPPLSGPHIFTGVIQTPPGGTIINNLTISALATPENPVRVRGLFGQTRDVSLSGFNLPNVSVTGDVTGSGVAAETGKIGGLVGYMQGGSLDTISLGSVTVSASRSGAGSNVIFLGGMAGVLEGVIAVTNVTAAALNVTEVTSSACNSGGLTGLLDQAGADTSMIGISIADVRVTGFQNQGGIIGQVSAGLNQMNNVTVGNGVFRFLGSNCGGMIGLLTCNNPSNLSNLTMTQMQVNEPNPPSTASHQGGFIGFSRLTAPLTVTNALAQSGAMYGNNRLGGGFGTVELRTNNCNFTDVRCGVNMFGRTASIGGVFGGLFIMTSDAPSSVTDCHCTAATVSSSGTGSGVCGGFGGAIGLSGITPLPTTPVIFVTDCTAAANVTSDTQECGGFVGRTSGTKYLRCKATGNVQTRRWLGGFHGNTDTPVPADPQNPSLQFVQCQARGNVISISNTATATDGTGGFSGNCAYGLIDRCFATGNVMADGESESGALVGLCFNPTVIRDSYATGNVSANETQDGAFLGHGRGSQVSRCYGFGFVTGTSAVGGLVGFLENVGANVSALSNCIALSPSAVATNDGGTVHRVCGQLGSGAILSQNFANSAMTLTSGGIPIIPINNPNGLDGQEMAIANLAATIASLGWNTATVWDTSTIATLGRPTLFGNPE